MADLAAPEAHQRAPGRVSRAMRHIFLRNLSSKIAALPMGATVLVIFVGCTLWTVL